MTSQAALHSNYTARKVVTVDQHESHASVSSVRRENDSSFCRPLQFAEVSLAAVFRDVTLRFPKRKFLSGERCLTSWKTAAKETAWAVYFSLYPEEGGKICSLKVARCVWVIFVYLYHLRHKYMYCNLITVWYALSQWWLAKQHKTNFYNNPLMHSLVSPQFHHVRNHWPMRQLAQPFPRVCGHNDLMCGDLIYSSPWSREVNYLPPFTRKGLLWLPREDLNV